MPYIGHNPTQAGSFVLLDDIASGFDGDDVTFTLQVGSVDITPTADNLIIALDGVIQHSPEAYTVSGSTLTFTAAPASGVDFYGMLMGQSASIGQGSIGADELAVTGDGSANQMLVSDGDGTMTWKGSGLSATSATGDLIYRNSSGELARLAVGSSGQVLTVASGVPAWETDVESYLPLSGGTMSGALNMGSQAITNAGTITGTFSGNLTGNVTGNVTGNTSGTAASVTGAAQTNITSVGTLTSLAITSSSATGLTVDVGLPSSANREIARFQAQSSRPIAFGWIDSGSKMSLFTPDNHSLVLGTGAIGTNNLEITDAGAVNLSHTLYAEGNIQTSDNLIVSTSGQTDYAIDNNGGAFRVYRVGTGAGMAIDTSLNTTLYGFVDIGAGDSGSVGSGGKQLRVSQDLSTTYSESDVGTWGGIVVGNHDDTSNRTSAGVAFAHRSSGSGVAGIISTSDAGDRGDLRFITRGSGNAIAERMVIDYDGKVTFSNELHIPQDIFHVGDDDTALRFGDDSWSVITGNSTRLTINNSSCTSKQLMQIDNDTEAIFRVRRGSRYSEFAQNSSGGVITGLDSSGNTGFQISAYGRFLLLGGGMRLGAAGGNENTDISTKYLEINGSWGDPAHGSAVDTKAILRVAGGGHSNTLDFGCSSSSPYNLWIQGTNRGTSGGNAGTYGLEIQPKGSYTIFGGQVGIGDKVGFPQSVGTPQLHLNTNNTSIESCQMLMQSESITVADGATHTIEITGTGALFFIQQNATGGAGGYASAMFYCNYSSNTSAGDTTLLSDLSGEFSPTKNASNKTCVYIEGYNLSVIIQNNRGASKNYTVQVIALHGQ